MRLIDKRTGPVVVKAEPRAKKLGVATTKKQHVAVRPTEKRGHNP